MLSVIWTRAATAAATLLSLCVIASSASAAQQSCAPRGFKVEQRSKAGVILTRLYRGNFEFESGAVRRYACSRTYRRLVAIGLEGVHPDGERWARVLSLNKRYAAVAVGGAGNAGGGSDHSLVVHDLKTGRVHSQGSPGIEPAWYGVVKLIMKSNGDVAYIARVSGTAAPTFQVWTRSIDGPLLLTTVDNIDPTYLQFGPTGEVLWRTK